MNLKNNHSIKRLQLLRTIKPSMKRVVWISSTLIVMLTLGLVSFFNFSDTIETIASTSEDNQCVTYSKTNHAGMTLENANTAGNHTSAVETINHEKYSEQKTSDGPHQQDQLTTDQHATDSQAEESKKLNATTHHNNEEANDLTELKIVSVGPNPFHDKLNVTFSQQVAFEVDFEMINTSGIAVFIDIINAKEGLNQYEFADQKVLPKGTYFMTLLYNHKKQVRKVIKN